jgi:muramidase (phage lysozyme)
MRPAAVVALFASSAFCAWALWQMQMQVQAGEEGSGEAPEEEGGIISDAVGVVQSIMTGTEEAMQSQNLRAFLMLIRSGESSTGASAYRMLYGGKLFSDFSDHPRVFRVLADGRRTSAAGAYQITATTWAGLGGKGKYGDFSAAAQDRAAVDLIRGRGALADVMAGRWKAAIRKLQKEWTSLPGAMEAGYSMDRAWAVLSQNGYEAAA